MMFSKEYLPSGHVYVRLFGIKILSYRGKRRISPDAERISVNGTDNALENIPPWCRVRVYGDRNRIAFVASKTYFLGDICLGAPDCPVKGCEVRIGEEVLSNGCTIVLMEDDSHVFIGGHSLLSSGVNVFCSDTHAILNGDGTLMNQGHYVEFGEHCWVGMNAFVLKNTRIGRDSVIGAHSVVAGGGDESGVVWAGNPAKIVRRGIVWDARRPNSFITKNVMEAR